VAAAVSDTFSFVRTASPRAKFIAVGPVSAPAYSSPEVARVRDVVRDEAAKTDAGCTRRMPGTPTSLRGSCQSCSEFWSRAPLGARGDQDRRCVTTPFNDVRDLRCRGSRRLEFCRAFWCLEVRHNGIADRQSVNAEH
jgi:hypothetical protein